MKLSYILGDGIPPPSNKLPHVSGNQTFSPLRKLLTFQEVTVSAQKMKEPALGVSYVFREKKLSRHKPKELLKFQEVNIYFYQIKNLILQSSGNK